MEEDNKVICPVCEHVITDFDEEISDPCEHVMLTYVDTLNGEFVHSAKEAEDLEKEMLARYAHLEETGEDKTLDELMQTYADENEGFEVIELTTYGLACGPVSSTEYHLIKTS